MEKTTHPADLCATSQTNERSVLHQWHETLWKYNAPPHVFTAGYGNRPASALLETARDYKAFVLDIRLSPASNREEWNRADLYALFGVRYAHLPELGNLNYKGKGGATEIADLECGILRVEEYLSAGKWPILLCGCAKEAGCHRAVVGAALWERGWRVGELVWKSDK